MEKQNIAEQGRNIPVMESCDVLVCGGGVAGVAAALAAARNGADVCLVEKGYVLGGLATIGLITDFLPLCDGEGHQVIGGIPEEFFRLAIQYGPGSIPDCWQEGGDIAQRAQHRLTAKFNPAWFQLALEQLLLKAHVRLMYDTRICAVVKDGNRVQAVIVENKSGRGTVTCKALVDATGDADVCFQAGEATESLDSNRRACWFYSYNGQKVQLHISGDIFFQPVPEGHPTFSGDNWRSVTAFMLDSRQLVLDKLEELHQRPETADAAPLLLAAYPQMRKTRRLKSDFELEVYDHKYYEDAIGMTGYYRNPGLILYIPYRALKAVKTENLLAAGRCISCLEPAWNITRGIPSCSITGQAAGTAAALCVKTGETVQSLKAEVLQNALREQGVIIDRGYARG